jgi:hypothetical protein
MNIEIDPISMALIKNPRAVAKAMVVLFSFQTAKERSTGITRESNGKGFSSYDDKKCSRYARWILRISNNASDEEVRTKIRNYLTHGHQPNNRDLTGTHLDDARMRSLKYVGQLKRYADSKKAASAAVTAPVTAPTEANDAADDS